jgi:hypothetical protein
MHADLDVAVFELDCRSVRPNRQLRQIFHRHLQQRADPLPWDQESGISGRYNLYRIPIGLGFSR